MTITCEDCKNEFTKVDETDLCHFCYRNKNEDDKKDKEREVFIK